MKKPVLIAIIAAAVLLLGAGVFFGITAVSVNNIAGSDKILENVSVLGMDVGGMTVKEAAGTLHNLETKPDSKLVKISCKGKEISVELRNAGFVFDAEKTAEKAYEVGRKGSMFAKNKAISNAKKGIVPEILPEYKTDQNILKEAVITLFAEQGIEFNKFVYELDGENAKIKITDNLEEIDFNKLFGDVSSALNQDEISVETVCIAGSPVTAEEILNSINVVATDARADEKDGITIIIPETNGVTANLDDITAAMYEGKTEFVIPVKRETPSVTMKSIQGDFFSDVLGTWTTNYNQGVVGRSANIALAASKINGAVLNSGDVFSFNGVVGRTTASTGFSMATVYTAEGMKPGIGGGICQVSSTLYIASLYADMKIVERRNHSYTVAYAKNGLDATVSYGSLDFKFKNEYKGPVKITASAGNGSVTVTIYGKKANNNKVVLDSVTHAYYPFNTVEKENPDLEPGTKKVTQAGSSGARATVTKTVLDENGNVIRQESLGTDYYQPMNQIVEVGPAIEEEPEEGGEATVPSEEVSAEPETAEPEAPAEEAPAEETQGE